MHEILSVLPKDSFVVDLGCDQGSFEAHSTSGQVIRLDHQLDSVGPGEFGVRSDASRLPFGTGSIDAIIANHSLEHFDDLAGCLSEIGRVTRRDGALFVSVPDASTITDKIYRWLARGGGHVNPFVNPDVLAATIERVTGLRHVATKTLCSSLSFLNRRNGPRPLPRRLLLLGGGFDWTLHVYIWLSRRINRLLGLRTSVYGWAFYFGSIAVPVGTSTELNVCIRCGSGTSSSKLAVRSSLLIFRVYSCPCCGTTNMFTVDSLNV